MIYAIISVTVGIHGSACQTTCAIARNVTGTRIAAADSTCVTDLLRCVWTAGTVTSVGQRQTAVRVTGTVSGHGKGTQSPVIALLRMENVLESYSLEPLTRCINA